MGASCSSIKEDGPEALEKEYTQGPRLRYFSKPVNTIPSRQHPSSAVTDSRHSKMSRLIKSKTGDSSSRQWVTVGALDEIIDAKVGTATTISSIISSNNSSSSSTGAGVVTVTDYQKQREELQRREGSLGFEHKLAKTASSKEKEVDEIIRNLRRDDDENVFAVEPTRQGFNGQQHQRFAGDHFLSNRVLIDRSKVLKVARKLPKGAHLHIHFNSCLQPSVLLDIASNMEHMYITSDLPLLDAQDYHNYKRAKIQFSIMAQASSTGNLFDAGYKDRQGAQKFKDFLKEFPSHRRDQDAMTWLQEKLVFREEEAHNMLQTVSGAWEEFNTRTQMMKGLFNYETAYRAYTRQCLEDFVADNIQYAEIRPNFMDTNQVWMDDGSSKIDNIGIMKMIIDEYEKFQAEAKRKPGAYFGGLKIIYCCPRSYSKDKVANGLKQCLEFKKRWPQWIAGFDLVGEEGKGKPLNFFIPEFLQFQNDCREAKVEIPFLFHCGETLEMGSETDGNLLDALLLKSKRIGHGFALTRHPYIMERMKQDNICIELCPISNEVLGLTPRANGHAMYALLANNVHCTVNSDNGTLFNSTLSHDFYQVMIGKSNMTLFGWKQLIEWSLEHACLSKKEYEAIHAAWAKKWEAFLDEVIAEFGASAVTVKTS